ncbi:MAG TPA: Abi-alpha family protein [Nocardioides sp.]|uniref:Abi-alpha family protein n=1 Tax=Nocardioides sp. TaxID=35761 RepID=UPI002EDA3647
MSAPVPVRPRRGGRLAPAVGALPGLTRVAGAAYLNAAEWGLRTSVRAGFRVARAVRDPDAAAELVRDATAAVTVVGELARAVASGVPVGTALVTAGESLGEVFEPGRAAPVVGEITPQSLRERGAQLLERSRDVWDTANGHPAYARILEELAPDEARILLLLLQGGPQPSVDVRTGGPVGMVNSQLIAPGLSMIGMRAGVRFPQSVPAYLNNLFRLGLVWFAKEPIRDPEEYQVVEAQPDVLAAVHSVKFAKVVRRSIHLTPFGEDFCRTVLVDETAAAEEFPEHDPPGEADAATPPTN